VISYLGQYGGRKLIPEWIDLGVLAAFSLLICALAVHLHLPAQRIITTIAAEQLDAPATHLDSQGPTTRITPPEHLDA
jgi:hypothetical protein